MALIQLGTADGSIIGNPTGTDYWFFNDSNNPDPTGEAQFTRRDSSGVDIVYGTGGGGGGDLLAANNLSDVALAFAAFNNIKQNGTTTFTGVGEIATQTEVNTGTASTRCVTPPTLANWTGITPSFNVDLDSADASVARAVAGGRTTFTITHGLSTKDIIGQVKRLSNDRQIDWRIETPTVNTLEASRAGTVADGLFRIIIKG